MCIKLLLDLTWQ